MNAVLDGWAAAAALQVVEWIAERVDESRRVWIVALSAELEELNGGWEKLQWALSGLTLAWSFRRPSDPQLQAAGFWRTPVDRHTMKAALHRHRSDVAALAVLAFAVILVGYALIPSVVLFGPLTASLLLFLYARSLGGWRRSVVGIAAICGVGGALYQMWGPAKGDPAQSKLLFVADGLEPGKSPWRSERERERRDEVFYGLRRQAKASFARGDVVEARRSATLLLSMSNRYVGDWNYGNAVHDGNLVLGRLAVKEGKLEEAGRRLLQAGTTPGSPQLNSFGPNMSLAKDLLQAGERGPVLAYFELCQRFWRMDSGKLPLWRAEVLAGKIPDFGSNLKY